MTHKQKGELYHTLYVTYDTWKNMEYMGKHSTYDLDDGYMGTGPTIYKELKEHKKNYPNDTTRFKKIIFRICEDRKEMNRLEMLIVDDNYCKRSDTYNKIPGGTGWPKGKKYDEDTLAKGRHARYQTRVEQLKLLGTTPEIEDKKQKMLKNIIQIIKKDNKQIKHLYPYIKRRFPKKLKPRVAWNKGKSSWNKGLTAETSTSVAKCRDALVGRMPWCKGLTKETDERIKKMNEKGPWNKGLTKETDTRVSGNGEAISKAKKGVYRSSRHSDMGLYE